MKKVSFNRLIIKFKVIFGCLALLFFLLFSANTNAGGYPQWYSLGTTIIELFAFLLAAILCLRNAFSNTIVSNRTVWLGIGLGLLSYFIGNLFFAYWELGLQREPDVSPGDLFYILSYLLLMGAMGLAVFERRLNLERWQYAVIAAVGVLGVGIAVGLAVQGQAPTDTAAQFDRLHTISLSPITPHQSNLLALPIEATPMLQTLIAQAALPEASGWVLAIEAFLQPFKGYLGFFYLIADTVLLILATSLFLAFWGGRFAQSWRMIAAAAFCLYIADASFKFATLPDRAATYQSGGLLEVGWVLSAVLFGLGAALEYEASQLRRGSLRRRVV